MAFMAPWGTRTRCLLSNWNESDILVVEKKYAQAKCVGIRVSLGVISALGTVSILKEAGKGITNYYTTYYGQKYIGGVLVIVSGYLGFGGIPLLTNATKVVKCAKACHNCYSAIMDASETTAGIPLIALEVAVFGRPVPKQDNSTFSWYPEATDFLKKLPPLD